jgi:hypothetical protein
MEAAGYSEKSVYFYQTARRHIPEKEHFIVTAKKSDVHQRQEQQVSPKFLFFLPCTVDKQFATLTNKMHSVVPYIFIL